MLYDPKWEKQNETKPNPIRDTLIEARRKIEIEANWLNRMPERREEASGQFCSARAIWTCGGQMEHTPATNGAFFALEAVMGMPVPAFNDTHTHAEILAAFDRAIAAA